MIEIIEHVWGLIALVLRASFAIACVLYGTFRLSEDNNWPDYIVFMSIALILLK